MQKFLLGKGDPNDLVALTATVNIWDSIKRRVNHEREMESFEQRSFDATEWASLDTLMNRMVNLGDLAQKISLAVENPAASQDESQDSASEANEDEGDYSQDTSPLQWRYGRMKFGIKIKPESVLHLVFLELD